MLVPGLTEVAGTSAAGKTQFCLQLCLTVQLPRKHGGLEGGECSVVSICMFKVCFVAKLLIVKLCQGFS